MRHLCLLVSPPELSGHRGVASRTRDDRIGDFNDERTPVKIQDL